MSPLALNATVTLLAIALGVLVARCRKKPTLYIIQGFLGAGKSTYSRKLAAQTGAVRLNADEYCAENFPPEKLAAEWEACFASAVTQLWRDAGKHLGAGRSVIFDMGFWDRASRDYARAQAAIFGAKAVLHYVTAPDAVLLSRLALRKGPIAENNLKNFHDIRRHFTLPAPDENAVVIDTGEQIPPSPVG